MKRLFCPASVMSVLMLVCSCEKDDIVGNVSDEYIDPSDSDNIEVYYEKLYNPSEFCDFIGNSMSDYMEQLFSEEANAIFKASVSTAFAHTRSAVDSQVALEKNTSELLARSMWQVRRINYRYWSVSQAGTPIQLSASVIVPALRNANVSHTLSGLSMCAPHKSATKEHCPTVAGTLLMARVGFNHAVVVPDYEGRGISSDFEFYSGKMLPHARQMIDATLAAMTILRNDGYVFSEDFGTYNIGISEGGGVVYCAHKLIENDIAPAQRDRINLKMTFSANGCVSMRNYSTVLIDNNTFTEESLPEVTELLHQYLDRIPVSERNGHTADELLSPDILGQDGKLNMDNPAIRFIVEYMSKDDIAYNWNPQHPIVFEGSYDDSTIDFESQGAFAYDLLVRRPDGTENGNVRMQSFPTPISAKIGEYLGSEYMFSHLMADFISFNKAMNWLDPTGK